MVGYLKDGVLNHTKINQKIYSGIEKGPLKSVNAVVVHQTDAPTAEHTFNSYSKGGHGAHFLISKKGEIFQTARLNQITHHVGKIKSKCYESKSCEKNELTKVKEILFKPKTPYGTRIKNLHDREKNKTYPNRYPLNSDSLGIEIVGDYIEKTKSYEAVSTMQNNALNWLINELYNHFNISHLDIYRHPEVSYKQPTEAQTANWSYL